MKRIPIMLVLAVGLSACGADDAASPSTPTAQSTSVTVSSPRPGGSAQPRSTRQPRPTPAPQREYIVRAGDTLYSLARRFGLSVQALADYNRLEDPSKIIVGQRLRIPLAAIAEASPTARPTPPRVHGDNCEFRFGFKELYNLIPNSVGQCLENEQYDVSGNNLQRTTGGLLVWRKADNLTTFTDGNWTWIHRSDGFEKKRNGNRLDWDPPEPMLAQVLDTLRTTPTGKRVYTQFILSGATIKFEHLEGPISSYSPIRNLIIINERYRNESPEELAHTLIWPMVGLHNDAGRSPSWSTCMNRVIDQQVTQAHWWHELFGEDGKGEPTDLEQWANYEMTLLLNESLRYWVQLSPHFREQCAKYGASPQRIDPVLARAYRTALMGGESALGKAAAAMVIAAGTEVVFGPAQGYGYFNPAHSRIVVNEDLRDASADVQAAVLIHETMHVAQYQVRKGLRSPAQCVEDEIEAFKAEAEWWADRHGHEGKANPSQAEKRMNDLVHAWLNELLEAFVLLSDGYQQQCLGDVIDS